jgi:hypothetical protein
MTRVNRAALAVVGVGVLVVAGCSSSPSSPKQKLIKSADGVCGTINKRFAGDLAYGKGIGTGDVAKLQERVTLLTGLRDRVRAMPEPETGRAELTAWQGKLGKYITDLDDLKGQLTNYRAGMDLLLAMQTGIDDDDAKAIAPAARRFGFKDCAQTAKWDYITP